MTFGATLRRAAKAASRLAQAILDAITGKGSAAAGAEALAEVAQDALMDSVNDILIPAMREKLEENKSMFTGELAKGLHAQKVDSNSVEIHTTVDYAGILEFGSAPRSIGADEFGNLVEWAEFKFPGSDDPEAIAKAVAKAIQENGNQPHPFAGPALNETEQLIRDNVAQDIEIKIRL